jgi:hypothetical protein
MDNIGDIVYFIFIILFFVIMPILRKRKKAQQKNQPTPPVSPKPKKPAQTLEDILGELFDAKPKAEQQKKSVEQPQVVTEEEPKHIFDDDYVEQNETFGKKIKAHHEEPLIDNPYMEYLKSDDYTREQKTEASGMPDNRHYELDYEVEKPSADIDLRKAIVYQAILERKYFEV